MYLFADALEFRLLEVGLALSLCGLVSAVINQRISIRFRSTFEWGKHEKIHLLSFYSKLHLIGLDTAEQN